MSRKRQGHPQAGRPPDPVYDAAFEEAIVERLPPPSRFSVLTRIGGIALVFGLTWHAIHYRGASATSLLLPLVAEILVAVVVGFVLAGVIVREPRFRREVFGALGFWVPAVVGLALWQWYQADRAGVALMQHLAQQARQVVEFALANEMQWAMLAGAASLILSTSGDVAAYWRKGPPFVYLGSLNLGMRLFAIMTLAMLLLFTFESNRRARAEVMWFVLLLADVFALWAPWAVQKMVRKERDEKKSKKRENAGNGGQGAQ